MTRLTTIAIIALLSPSLQARAQSESVQPSTPVVEGVVRIADHIKLPAQEPGVLVHLDVKEGTQVRAGQIIGKIDDREIQAQQNAANAAFQGAVKRYKDDVDIRYSEAAAEHALATLEVMRSANKMVERAITGVEIREAELNHKKMVLASEKATKEQELAKYDAYVKQAELEAAKLGIERRTIVAPFDGIVERVSRKQDEWVNPGDTILELFRMDTVHIEGAVDWKRYDPHELQGCKVTVEVQMARGRKKTVEGQITKVSSIVRDDGAYNIRAEVANRQEQGTWLLRDGLPAIMHIHLGTGGAAAPQIGRTP